MFWKLNAYYVQTSIIKIEKFNNSRDDGQLKNMKALPLQLMIAEMLTTYVLHNMSVFWYILLCERLNREVGDKLLLLKTGRGNSSF